MNKEIKSFLFRVLCGFFLGISVVAPGVSGSIMAVMMGIYRDLINIISNPLKNFKKNFFYLLPMGIGALLALVIFVKLLSFAFDIYPAQSQFLFMGLIAGSFVEVYRQVSKVKFRHRYLIGVAAAFGVALPMNLLGSGVSAFSIDQVSLWYLGIAGLVAGIFSIIPGMSVSLVLMLFGVYDYLLKTASSFSSDFEHFLLVVAVVGGCFVAGMIAFSKIIKTLFDQYPGAAYFIVLGFLCGTLISVFPGNLPNTGYAWSSCVLIFCVGICISVGFQFFGKKLNIDELQDKDELTQ